MLQGMGILMKKDCPTWIMAEGVAGQRALFCIFRKVFIMVQFSLCSN